MGSKHCNNNVRIVWTARWTMLKKINLIWSYSMRLSFSASPVDLGCWVHQLSLQRDKTCLISGYDTKQSDSEASVMLELWGMQSTYSLPLLSSPLWTGVVASDRFLSMGQIELFVHLTNDWCLIELLVIHSNTWNYFTLLTYVYKSYI